MTKTAEGYMLYGKTTTGLVFRFTREPLTVRAALAVQAVLNRRCRDSHWSVFMLRKEAEAFSEDGIWDVILPGERFQNAADFVARLMLAGVVDKLGGGAYRVNGELMRGAASIAAKFCITDETTGNLLAKNLIY